MCAQLDLEVRCNRREHIIFINFGIKKFTVKHIPPKKTLMFECSYLIDPKERGAPIF
jgi:hypothetical protein